MNRFVAAVLVTGCSSPPPDVLEARKIPEALQPDVAAVVASNNQFACDIYAQLGQANPNMVFSAFSMSTAFAMLDAGARTVSDAEIRSTFHWTLDGDRLHAAYGALLTSLDTGRDYNTYTLATADRLFGQDGFPFQDDFVATTKDDYQAELLPVDFANNIDGAVQTIDQWVSDQTDAKIPQLFTTQDLGPDTVLALVNAILFKGNWEKHFDHDRTADGTFYRADGTTVTATLMTKSDALAQAPIPGGRLAVLPFDGKDLEMVILLPSTADGLPALEAQLTGDALTGWITGATAGDDQDIVLPKFALDSSYGLPQALQALGIVSVWNPATADLSGIDGTRDLYVNAAIHKAMITVDEDGAEAAAATGIGVGDGAASEPFRVDHPFIFAIFDNVTNSVLFMGRVEDPSM